MKTPIKSRLNTTIYEPHTPMSFSKELKNVLNERNLLTAKTRKRVCSMLDSSAEQNDGTNKRHQFRIQAIEEILNSEKTYLGQLETLMKYFIIPLKEKEIINDSSHATLFGQIEMIYNLNRELLKELENDLENVGNAFLKMAPFFKLYSVYAFDYRNALFILQDLTNKNQAFHKFLLDNESRPEVQKKLNSLLIAPIQRVPRYKLLLEQVLMYTSPADYDFKILKQSVKEIESTASHINSVVEDQEITQILLNLQNSLVNRTPNIVKPSRKVIKEGVLNKVTRNGTQVKRFCVLMSDIFMYCKILKDRSKNTQVENSLECCCIFPLKKCKIFELFPGNFKISCQGDGLILCTSDLHIGQSWVLAMKESIEMHIECRKTLRKESSKRTPMRRKEIKKFELDSVLSPYRRKCDYESVFRCKTIEDSNDGNESPKISCFNVSSIRSNILKRKHANEIPKQDVPLKFLEEIKTLPLFTKNDSVQFKIPELPQNGLSKLKNFWHSSEKIEQNKTKFLHKTDLSHKNNKILRNPVDEIDPTYGFANRFSVTKSYFRTNNIDSTIPTPIIREDMLQMTTDGGTPILDVLYPLRTSGGSTKSGKGWKNGAGKQQNDLYNYEKENNNQMTFSWQNSPELNRKKVKFSDDTMQSSISIMQKNYCSNMKLEDDNLKFWEKTGPFEFPRETDNSKNQNSLSQRIVKFFSRLF